MVSYLYGRKATQRTSHLKMAFILEYLALRPMASYGAMIADFDDAMHDPHVLRHALDKLLYEGQVEKCINPVTRNLNYRRTKRNGAKLSTTGHRDVRPAPDNVG